MNPSPLHTNPSLLRRIFCAMGLASCGLFAEEVATENFQRFTALPVLGYSEETELQYGAMGILFFRPGEPGGKVSELGLMAYGTTRSQFQLQVEPHFFLYHDRIRGTVSLKYQNWVGHYFGMGNDVDFDSYRGFDVDRIYLDAEIQSTIGLPQAFNYGLKLHLEHSNYEFKECEDCTIATPDAKDGWHNGAGYLLSYDTRDNLNWTANGFLVQWQQLFFSDHFGDYSFNTESLDLRGYTPLFWNITMATSALWMRSGGDVPFDKLSGPDGTKRFRGVESLYFRDNQGFTLQAEFRKFLGWRLAGDIFFEGSKVGDHFSELMRNEWHQAVGFGGMLALNKKERLYARGEFSWVDYKKLGMTVYVRSAF